MEDNKQLSQEEYEKYISQWKLENKELIDSGKCRKVFLECLPITTKGVNWVNSIGYNFHFIYENKNGFIKIIFYNKETRKITLEYNKTYLNISSGNIQKHRIGAIFNKYSKEYRFNLKEIVKDDFGIGKVIDQIRIGKANHKGYKIKCENCNHTYNRTENHIINRDGFKCPNCYNKGNSFGEKFMFNLLQQLSIKFKKETTFDWSKNIQVDNAKLCGNKRYDFYLNKYTTLVEIHGRQHYEEGFKSIRSKTLKEEQENDILKKELALSNGIKPENYIVIDCRKSELEWIKEHILDSNLSKIFDLSKIDWLKCAEYSNKDIVQFVSKMKNENPNMTITNISNYTNLGLGAIRGYIKQGVDIGICDYDAKEEMIRSGEKAGERTTIRLGKEIICVDNGIVLKNASEFEEKSIDIFGEKFKKNNITRVCRKERNTYKGFIFRYTEDLTEEQIKEIQENAKLNKAI